MSNKTDINILLQVPEELRSCIAINFKVLQSNVPSFLLTRYTSRPHSAYKLDLHAAAPPDRHGRGRDHRRTWSTKATHCSWRWTVAQAGFLQSTTPFCSAYCTGSRSPGEQPAPTVLARERVRASVKLRPQKSHLLSIQWRSDGNPFFSTLVFYRMPCNSSKEKSKLWK